MAILVTCSSRHGATAREAEAIGTAIAEDGTFVDILPMKQVADLSHYHAIIDRSAIQSAQWLPEAAEFLWKNQTVLALIPCAMFSVCMTLAMPNGEKYRDGIRYWEEPLRCQIRPVSEKFFAGILDIKKVPAFSHRLKFRISMASGVWKEGDHRNWQKILEWAQEAGRLLKVEV